MPSLFPIILLSGEAIKYCPHGINASDVGPDILVTAMLFATWPEGSAGILVRCTGTAQVNDGRKLQFVLRRHAIKSTALAYRPDVVIKIGSGEFGGVRGNHTRVETVEPARVPVIPGTILGDHVILNAIVSGLGEGRICDLIHSDSARCWPIYLQRMQAP